MIFILAPSTMINRWALKARRLPGLMLTDVRPWPRWLVLSPTFWRMAIEPHMVRNGAAVLPVPAAILFAPDLVQASLALSPVLLALVLFAEGDLLPVRAKAGESDNAQRLLDLLNQRGRQVLTRIAAERGIARGKLRLVLEQSALARLPAITLVSIQSEADGGVLDLTRAEQRMVRERLFAPGLTEAELKRVNIVERKLVREIVIEAQSVSAHARLAAAARRAEETVKPWWLRQPQV